MTARNTAPYLLCLLAVIAAGAVAVPVNPASAPAELAGLAGQVRPRLLVTDPTLAGLVEAAGITGVPGASADELAGPAAGSAELQVRARPDDLAVLIPTSGTTGRSKLVMQTHRAYAMAGEGFPYWMGLDRDDRLMTSLPLFHINATAYSVLGSLACGAGLVLLPRFSASGFLDSARRHGATEFNAIGAMLEILMRQPERPDDADTDLRLCYTGPSPAREWQEAFERRFGLRVVCRVRDVGVAVRADLAARHAPVRHARLGPAAPDPGPDQRGAGGRRRRARRSAPARPASCCCATRS